MIRDDIKNQLTAAMKARETDKIATLRLVQAAIKNRDIEARTATAPTDDDALVIEVLQKMAKQRRESIEMFDKAGRTELSAGEQAELRVIESFLPARMDETEAMAAIRALITESGATGIKDMGRVMALIKERLAGKIDMANASRMVKAALS